MGPRGSPWGPVTSPQPERVRGSPGRRLRAGARRGDERRRTDRAERRRRGPPGSAGHRGEPGAGSGGAPGGPGTGRVWSAAAQGPTQRARRRPRGVSRGPQDGPPGVRADAGPSRSSRAAAGVVAGAACVRTPECPPRLSGRPRGGARAVRVSCGPTTARTRRAVSVGSQLRRQPPGLETGRRAARSRALGTAGGGGAAGPWGQRGTGAPRRPALGGGGGCAPRTGASLTPTPLLP